MRIIGIETSCDETAISLLNCTGSIKNENLKVEVRGEALQSQIESHRKFGGVVPMMAKREHAKNLIPLFLKVLKEAQMTFPHSNDREERIFDLTSMQKQKLDEIFGREKEFKNEFIKMVKEIMMSTVSTVPVDTVEAIAVTEGPGLEPALWMGIIFAKALSFIFDIPLIPVNHMEGHIISALPKSNKENVSTVRVDTYEMNEKIEFPIVSLLISGGHTELILIEKWNKYKLIGETRDDAVGEAFDKVARMLELPYPGGPEISKLAEKKRLSTVPVDSEYILPRPMIKSGDYNFSFSGLKTAVLYSLKNGEVAKDVVAKEFEEAVTEVLLSKTMSALKKFKAKTLIIGGGVISNKYIQLRFEEEIKKMDEIKLFIPEEKLRTDNALMIAMAGYEKILVGLEKREIKAKGTLRLS